jgi:hypothetical protein
LRARRRVAPLPVLERELIGPLERQGDDLSSVSLDKRRLFRIARAEVGIEDLDQMGGGASCDAVVAVPDRISLT